MFSSCVQRDCDCDWGLVVMDQTLGYGRYTTRKMCRSAVSTVRHDGFLVGKIVAT